MAPPQWPTPASPPTTENTTNTSAPARWWNGWYTVFVVFLGAYAIYVIFVVGRMTTHGLDEDAAPRPLNAIVLTALSLGTILSYQAAGRLHRRKTDSRWQLAVLTAIQAATSSSDRDSDEPTVPVATRGVVYAAAAAVSSSLPGYPLPETLKQWVNDYVDNRVDRRVDDVLADVRRLTAVDREMDTPAGAWAEKVTPIPHGRR